MLSHTTFGVSSHFRDATPRARSKPRARNAAPRSNRRFGVAAPRFINLVALTLVCACGSVSACWEDASARHGVPVELLLAIARTESGLDASAVHRNNDLAASYDIGLMQINSAHLPTLRKYGIDEPALFDPCVNLHVGAWILADLWRRLGPGWDAVGAYNASCSHLRGPACTQARARYAWRVYRNLDAPSAPHVPRASARDGKPVP